MTTISDIEGEIEDVGESVLSDLDADERAKLAIRLTAAGNRERLSELEATAPTREYRITGAEYKETVKDTILMAVLALLDLETGMLKYHYLEERDLDFIEEDPSLSVAIRLLGYYSAWERYAEEEVGIGLTEFLTCPFGGLNAESINFLQLTIKIARAQVAGEDNDQDLTAMYSGDDLTVQEIADRKYASLTDGEGPLIS